MEGTLWRVGKVKRVLWNNWCEECEHGRNSLASG